MDMAQDITGPVNVRNPAEFTIMELAQMTMSLVGSQSKIVHRPLSENDPKARYFIRL